MSLIEAFGDGSMHKQNFMHLQNSTVSIKDADKTKQWFCVVVKSE